MPQGFLSSRNERDIMPTASYFFGAISGSKDLEQFTQGEIDKDYKPYVVNRMVAGYRDLVMFADELNVRPNIAKEDQLFLYNELIPKKKRRALWTNTKLSEDIKIVMEYYNISQEKADPYMKILSTEQIATLKERLNKGGRG